MCVYVSIDRNLRCVIHICCPCHWIYASVQHLILISRKFNKDPCIVTLIFVKSYSPLYYHIAIYLDFLLILLCSTFFVLFWFSLIPLFCLYVVMSMLCVQFNFCSFSSQVIITNKNSSAYTLPPKSLGSTAFFYTKRHFSDCIFVYFHRSNFNEILRIGFSLV